MCTWARASSPPPRAWPSRPTSRCWWTATVDDLIVSAGLTGTPASWLKPSLRANGLDPDALPAAPERNYNSNTAIAAKKWMDVWAAGQGVGAIRAVQPVAEVVAEIEREFLQAQARFASWRAMPERTG